MTGDANGVVGISSSPDGVGVLAAGAEAGADLLLDGSTSAETDLLMSQNGIDRASASPETPTIENSGGGGLSDDIQGAASIAGAVTAGSFTGDGGGLTGITADDVDCIHCVHITDLAPNSVSGGIVVDNSLTSADIGSSAVGNSELASNAVTSFKIATSAVNSRTIGPSAVRGPELATIRLVSVECNGGCGDSTLGQVCGTGFEAISVDCDVVDDDSVTVPCGGNNVCSRQNILDTTPLSNFCVGQAGRFDAHVFCIPD